MKLQEQEKIQKTSKKIVKQERRIVTTSLYQIAIEEPSTAEIYPREHEVELFKVATLNEEHPLLKNLETNDLTIKILNHFNYLDQRFYIIEVLHKFLSNKSNPTKELVVLEQFLVENFSSILNDYFYKLVIEQYKKGQKAQTTTQQEMLSVQEA